MALTPFRTVDDVVAALEGLDGRTSDDVVAALPHLLQTAERLDTGVPPDPQLVVAGLLHDVASALELGCPDHAGLGAELTAPLFGARVAELVGGHTDAKRYLVAVDPTYAAGLSANSTHTLVGQGGPMDEVEVAAFAARPERDSLVALRRADDAAKVPGAEVRAPEAWRPLLDAVAARAVHAPA